MISKEFSEFSEFSKCFVVFVNTQAIGYICGSDVRGLWKRRLGIARQLQPGSDVERVDLKIVH